MEIKRRELARSVENIRAVQESATENPQMSVERRSEHLGISRTLTWRILKKDLGLDPYTIQLTQQVKPADHGQRSAFTDGILQCKIFFAIKLFSVTRLISIWTVT